MFPKRPRIKDFPYIGFYRYSLTICTKERKTLFTESDIVAAILTTIRQHAHLHGFAITAYCFMPDHIHLIVHATTEAAELRPFMKGWKQRAGLDYKQSTGDFLWQPSYFDHVLRDNEEMKRAVKYVLENPVRKGLVANWADYPFSGSDVYSVEELAEFWREEQD